MSIVTEPYHRETMERPVGPAEYDESVWQLVYRPMVEHGCFYCGQEFETYPAIQWAGAHGTISLHPVCCHELANKLRADLRRVYTPRCGVALTEERA